MTLPPRLPWFLAVTVLLAGCRTYPEECPLDTGHRFVPNDEWAAETDGDTAMTPSECEAVRGEEQDDAHTCRWVGRDERGRATVECWECDLY
jgi:hypothetical protein